MTAYLSASKKAAILKKMRAPNHDDVKIVLDELAAAIAQSVSDAAIQADNVAALSQDVSETYVEAEVQAISDKVDAILAALKASGLMAADA